MLFILSRMTSDQYFRKVFRVGYTPYQSVDSGSELILVTDCYEILTEGGINIWETIGSPGN